MTSTDEQKTRDEQWVYLAQWLNLSLGEKEWRGLPLTEQELVDMWGVGSTRTLRNWKEKPEFQSLKKLYANKKINELHARRLLTPAQKSLRYGTGEPEEPQAPTVEPITGNHRGPVSLANEANFRETAGNLETTGDPMMDMVRANAMGGDEKAMRMYFQYYGKFQAEQSAKAAGIPYETVELKRMLVENWSAIGEEHLVNIMNELGYSVLPREK